MSTFAIFHIMDINGHVTPTITDQSVCNRLIKILSETNRPLIASMYYNTVCITIQYYIEHLTP